MIEGWLREQSDEAEMGADVVYRAAGVSAVCMADYDGRRLEVPLKRRGSEVFRSVVEDFYHASP